MTFANTQPLAEMTRVQSILMIIRDPDVLAWVFFDVTFTRTAAGSGYGFRRTRRKVCSHTVGR